jgi:hypothetical protein
LFICCHDAVTTLLDKLGLSNSSVAPVAAFDGICPPKASPTVLVPDPAASFLAVFNSSTCDQVVPFQDSVAATGPGL